MVSAIDPIAEPLLDPEPDEGDLAVAQEVIAEASVEVDDDASEDEKDLDDLFDDLMIADDSEEP